MRPASLPTAQALGPRHAHGTRIRYMGGCRCVPCRAANSRAISEMDANRRAGRGNGIVSASAAQAHLLFLSAQGVGYKTVARVTGCAFSILAGIRSGRRRYCREGTARAILAVTSAAAAQGATVDAGETWEQIATLRRGGWTKAAIAKALGYQRPVLQIRKGRGLRRTADAVRRLYRTAPIRLRPA